MSASPPPVGLPLPAARGLLMRAAGTLLRRPGASPSLGAEARRYVAPPLDPAWLAAYHAFFGGFRSEVPLTALYPLAQRAQLAEMVAPGFPYRVVGMVHLANEQRLVAPIEPAQGFSLEVAAMPVDWPGAPKWDCVAFDVAFRQCESLRATCRSVYLARRRGRREQAAEAVSATETNFLTERWVLAADEGRRYAALSGDHNPIHLSPWLSRWFGFPRPILHGMDGLARAAAAIERALDLPLGGIEAEFGRAVGLPGEVALSAWRTGEGAGGFVLQGADGETRHVVGAFGV